MRGAYCIMSGKDKKFEEGAQKPWQFPGGPSAHLSFFVLDAEQLVPNRKLAPHKS